LSFVVSFINLFTSPFLRHKTFVQPPVLNLCIFLKTTDWVTCPRKQPGNSKVLFYNFNHLTVNPSNAMLSQQILLMYAPLTEQNRTEQHSTQTQCSNSHAISAVVSRRRHTRSAEHRQSKERTGKCSAITNTNPEYRSHVYCTRHRLRDVATGYLERTWLRQRYT
jgi:hypothetical protein